MADLREIGFSGLAEWGGYIEEDFLREMRGRDAYKRFNEMRLNSAVAGGMLTAIELAIRGVDWTFVSDKENDPRVELLENSLNSMSTNWNDHISEALTMLPFGYSVFEICYRREGGNIVWRKFAPRGQDTIEKWLFDQTGGLQGFVQRASPSYSDITIPIEKTILYRTKVEKNNPEGRSVFRTAWISYYYQKNIQMIEGIGIERDLAGMPVIRLPEDATTGSGADTDESIAKKIVRNIRRDEQEGVVLPASWEFELVSSGGSRQFDTNEIIKRYESRILLSMLAQFLLLGQDRVGAQALSKDQTDFFAMAVNSVADIIAETFLKYPVPRLLALNGYDAEGIGFDHTPAGDIDLLAVADFLQKTQSQSLVTWMPEDEVWLRGMAKLPDMEIERIVEERESKAQRALEIASLNRFKNNNNQDRDDNTVVGFTATNAPDDKERRQWENTYRVLHEDFFRSQKNRVLDKARKMTHGV